MTAEHEYLTPLIERAVVRLRSWAARHPDHTRPDDVIKRIAASQSREGTSQVEVAYIFDQTCNALWSEWDGIEGERELLSEADDDLV